MDWASTSTMCHFSIHHKNSGYNKEFLGEPERYSATYKSAILCFNCWVVSMSVRVPWISQPSANGQSYSSSFSCCLEISSTPPRSNWKTSAWAVHWFCKIASPAWLLDTRDHPLSHLITWTCIHYKVSDVDNISSSILEPKFSILEYIPVINTLM